MSMLNYTEIVENAALCSVINFFNSSGLVNNADKVAVLYNSKGRVLLHPLAESPQTLPPHLSE